MGCTRSNGLCYGCHWHGLCLWRRMLPAIERRHGAPPGHLRLDFPTPWPALPPTGVGHPVRYLRGTEVSLGSEPVLLLLRGIWVVGVCVIPGIQDFHRTFWETFTSFALGRACFLRRRRGHLFRSLRLLRAAISQGRLRASNRGGSRVRGFSPECSSINSLLFFLHIKRSNGRYCNEVFRPKKQR